MKINYKILNFNKSTLSMLVNYYSDEIPEGLTFNLDLPTDSQLTKDKLDAFVMMYAPRAQMERMQLVKKNAIDTSLIEALVQKETRTIDNLEATKLQAKSIINKKVEHALEMGVVYRGYRFDARRTSLATLGSFVTSINAGKSLPANFTWRTNVNIDVSMNTEQVKELHALMLEHYNSTYKTAWQKKEQISQSQTVAEVSLAKWILPGEVV